MKIQWINHASFLVDYDGVRLVCDPWLEGTAFDQGWALLSKTVFSYEDFKDVTHIWFSHEHPDHFSPPNLNKIPLEYRNRITVLYQETIDRKVVAYCRKAGFKDAIEMKRNTFHKLSDRFECLCHPFTDGDSFLYIKTDKTRLLNLNDCIVSTPEDVQRVARETGPVDILMTQFGYANKVGDKDDTQERVRSAAEKLQRIRRQTEGLKPEYIIPFASYVYFCHADNAYMNDAVNKIDRVYKFLTEDLGKKTVVLYPGEIWEVGASHDSTASVAKYMKDYERLETSPDVAFLPAKKVDLDVLKQKADSFRQTLIAKNGGAWFRFVKPFTVFLSDYDASYAFSVRKGLYAVDLPRESCDIVLTSDSLMYCFAQLWGGDTLQVNARFQLTPKGSYYRPRMYFLFASLNNRGEKMTIKQFLEFNAYGAYFRMRRMLKT